MRIVFPACHPHQLQQIQGALRPLGPGISSTIIHGKQDVLNSSEGGQELKELEDYTDRAPTPNSNSLLVEGVDVNMINDDFAGCGSVDARDHVDQRGFTAARLADDRDEGSSFNLQVNTFERGERAR